MPEILESKL